MSKGTIGDKDGGARTNVESDHGTILFAKVAEYWLDFEERFAEP